MSISASFGIPKGLTAEERAQIIDSAVVFGQDDLPEREPAIATAKAAVKAILESGAIGHPATLDTAVVIGGHLNAGNVAPDGCTKDGLNVSVGQSWYPVEHSVFPVSSTTGA